AVSAHARDELGITETLSAKPLQAAFTSALSFAAGAALPLLIAVLAPRERLIPFVALASLFFLALLGGLAAKLGGANVIKGVVRVTFWSLVAMAATTAIGALFGTAT
ncbi:MAG TPA: VIT1/CCC1 transporter family protein, partial [Burkholderiaceae bacterium]|nr:VIT1/CCC1 transporter family protein [Burkholderiaceae bacterium]